MRIIRAYPPRMYPWNHLDNNTVPSAPVWNNKYEREQDMKSLAEMIVDVFVLKRTNRGRLGSRTLFLHRGHSVFSGGKYKYVFYHKNRRLKPRDLMGLQKSREGIIMKRTAMLSIGEVAEEYVVHINRVTVPKRGRPVYIHQLTHPSPSNRKRRSPLMNMNIN